MRFEARELKAYAEPIASDALEAGHVYFFVHFLDDAMQVPMLEPMVFIGSNLEIGDKGQVWFQDYVSYSRGHRHDSPDAEDVSLYGGAKDELGHVFLFERAMDVLLQCSIRRATAGVD